ncbi:AraC family transcriptional regulator [candidate division KSB1 bacterium]|nr:AraC family transcriptional regulator [candidate division KSB1 bacterium]
MVKTLTDIVLSIAGFQLMLLALVLLNQESKNRLNRNLLVAFLLTKAFLMIRWFIFRYEILSYRDDIYIYHVSKSAFFLLAPILYFYIRSLCYKDFKFKKFDLIHFILFLLIIFFNIFSVKISLAGVENIWYHIFDVHHYQIFWTLNLIQIILYIVAMLRVVISYQSKIREVYSSIEKINLSWLFMLLLLITLHWVFVTSRATLVLLNIASGTLIQIIDLYSITIFLIFTTILVFKGIAQLKIFTGIEDKPKYAESKLPENEIQKHVNQLSHFMLREKPYLIPSLTIEDLSEKLAIPTWQLSQVINYTYNQNFFNYINRYRIEEVKQKLQKAADNRKTILEILYETGFNSKSTFNQVFKKHTGMTPSEFKRMNQN